MSASLNRLSPEHRRQVMADRINSLAQAHGGRIAGGIYSNKRSTIEFVCAHGHRWATQAQTVLSGSWCPTCWREQDAGKHLKLTDGISQAKSIAESRGGVCQSLEYRANNKRLEWQCGNGHQWQATLSDIKKGTWCPECGTGVRERLCRFLFEQISGTEFPKARPKWLINSRGNRMELDGFSALLSVAFEHHGEQHFQHLPHFQRGDETLAVRIRDDDHKRALCRINGVFLIEVPYFIPENQLPQWIFDRLENLLPMEALNRAALHGGAPFIPSTALDELRHLAQQSGGECLSAIYLGVSVKHRFRCHQGHEWEATPANVKTGTWCPECKPDRIGDSNRKRTLNDMQQLAATRGGTFLSLEFRSVNHKYRWCCAMGHEWEAAPVDIQKGTWCPRCARESMKDSLEDMQLIARSRGGLCLSDLYINQSTKLLWRCSAGHEWQATPSNIKGSKSWCPECAKAARAKTGAKNGTHNPAVHSDAAR
jgi:Probable Zinc-ribbon domain